MSLEHRITYILLGAAMAFAFITATDAVAARLVRARRDSFTVVRDFKA